MIACQNISEECNIFRQLWEERRDLAWGLLQLVEKKLFGWTSISFSKQNEYTIFKIKVRWWNSSI